jgi:ABC-type bacteriocin/lantibiotic exporter with double-glycine peptidase domain
MESISCVRYICKHHRVPLQNIPAALTVVEALKTCGFFACEINTSMKGLTECPMPVIVQTVQRYVIITKANKFYVTSFDPGDNKIHRIAFLDFIKMWTGLVVVIEPPPRPHALSFLRSLFSQKP